MKRIPLIALIAFVGACGGPPAYKNASEFESALRSWSLVGLGAKEGTAFLSKNGFKCTISTCERQVPSMQRVRNDNALSYLSTVGKISEAKVWRFHGDELASVCL